MIKIDARGLNCPKPVILAKKQLDEMEKGEIEVTVDNKVATENLSRLAKGQNYQYSVVTLSETEYVVTISKSERKEGSCEIIDDEVLNISIFSSTMGGGDEELGKILMKSFMYTVSETKPLPKTILFYNSGVFLTCEGSPVLDDLKKLEEMGVEIHSCGTCLDFYDMKDKFKVGLISNMYTIYELMKEATKECEYRIMNVVLLTFDSVNFTMQTEKKLLEKGYEVKTIPTPREISRSCGLTIMLKKENLEDIVKLKEELPIGYIWEYKKNDGVVEVKSSING